MAANKNARNPAVKRIVQEIKEMQETMETMRTGDGPPAFAAEALESDVFEWHFVLRGPSGSDFEGGLYHGRILLPPDYPFKPPSFIMLSQSGRFETNTKICLSISSHHPEQWQPSWSMRTALTALIAFFPTPGKGALGAVDMPSSDRRELAAQSRASIPSASNPERRQVMQRLHDFMLQHEAVSRGPPADEAAAAPGAGNINATSRSTTTAAEVPPSGAAKAPAAAQDGAAVRGDVCGGGATCVHSHVGQRGAAAGEPVAAGQHGQRTRAQDLTGWLLAVDQLLIAVCLILALLVTMRILL